MVAQSRQHEALDNLHGDFDLGFVAWFAWARRQDRGVVVLGQFLIGAIDAGLVAARDGDAGLQVVAHDPLRHAADIGQCIDMAASMGIATQRIDALTFGLGSGIAGIAGVALSQIDNVSPNLGQSYIIDSFML